MTVNRIPRRIAVVGCGAVTRLYYIPALQLLERERRAQVVAAFDPDATATNSFCTPFRDAAAMASLNALMACRADVVIVASPPRFHTEQVELALAAGSDVHCEKPFALDVADAKRMVAAAAAAERRLTVGLVRRHLPATAEIRALVTGGALGRIENVQCFEGGPFDWPVQSAAYFRAENGNGVLRDVGTHCLDLLHWWFGEPTSLAYTDDALGGVEANCRVEAKFGDVRAVVRLSRDWPRPNRYLISGTRGWLRWTVNDANRYEFGIRGSDHVGVVTVCDASRQGSETIAGAVVGEFDTAFAAQLRALVEPERSASAVTGQDALPSVRLVERCYELRRPMWMPWMPTPGTVS